ncbi:exonuclease II [Thelephora terrestris]|uniref:5'-3' exoribonuclease 1 n=1 Tax=Thelephora terrestris TaxID=56493 RepID=A0A9P6H7S1_9AGAM|nr:exonuclease II [Thelephora terrestris]
MVPRTAPICACVPATLFGIYLGLHNHGYVLVALWAPLADTAFPRIGIPKFFRYISERYPLTSQLIEENKIPEFDNLYVDFNGIIHQCSHPDDGDVYSRLSEEQIFASIFSYVDHLFGKIKPKKLFFIAVDGVAPRAKMNQQRSRRFRAAKEARGARERAGRKGAKLPEGKVFDSNCITPGTVFMAGLSEQLKYFVNKKISEDSHWRECQVILSGQEVPGEGEHKIMEYIRKSRAQPNHNPNIRHCLYGLDADLIMLGLLSHDPHFCLLREEVKFGPTRKKHNTRPESTNFHLLHLTLMREYLDLEFSEIKTLLPFNYSLERIIDDFVLLAVFIGNDFLPHLPDVHIRGDGLERLFEIYKQVLPLLDGYLNESGTINTARLQLLLDRMWKWDRESFHYQYEYDMNWIKEKQSGYSQPFQNGDSTIVMTRSQNEIFSQVKALVLERRSIPSTEQREVKLSFPNTFGAGERAFITKLADDLHLELSWDEYDEEDQNLAVLLFPGAFEPPSDEKVSESGSQGGVDTTAAVDCALRKYDEAKILMETPDDSFDSREGDKLKKKMDDWKRAYYAKKLRISYDDSDEMQQLVFCYIEGLQWVMNYYYSGVCSWGWFYRYHYAPRMSEVDKMEFRFELGEPFRPFEQLMGVLPEASKELVPLPYRPLMDDVSPIIDFYPREFELDMNGKKQEWEAVVKIPFIDENRLLQAMKPKEQKLTEEERRRNSFGTALSFSFRPEPPTEYPSSLPGTFPTLHRCLCSMEPYDLPSLDGLQLVQGLCDGVLLGAQSLAGFPTLKTVQCHAKIENHGVNIHGSESRNKSVVVYVENPYKNQETQKVATEMIGQRVFIGWPCLQEGMVTAVSDSSFKYRKTHGASEKVVSSPHPPQEVGLWKSKLERIEMFYSKRCGVVTGAIDVLVHVLPFKGMKSLESGAFVKEYETPDRETEQAVQMTITNVASEDPRYVERASLPLSEEFPIGKNVFFLGRQAYGAFAQVSGATETSLSVTLTCFAQGEDENERFKALVRSQPSERYYPFFAVAKIVGLSQKVVSRLTSRVMAIDGDHVGKINLGLSVKFEAKAQKVIGYSRKVSQHWEFSEKTVDLIKEYKENFPEVVKHLEKYGNDFLQLSEVFPGPGSDDRIKQLKAWLGAKGVRDFEAVPLNCDSVGKETVRRMEQLADQLSKGRAQGSKARIDGIPRQAVLKPEHAVYRLQDQRFAIGDRVVMAKDSGLVPLSIKGVIVGINAKALDVVWDISFMSGSTLVDKCSQRRGATVEFHACLNLSNPQVVTSNSSELQQLHLGGDLQRGTVQRPPPPSGGTRGPGLRGGPNQGGSVRGRGRFTGSIPPTRGGGPRGRGRGQSNLWAT